MLQKSSGQMWLSRCPLLLLAVMLWVHVLPVAAQTALVKNIPAERFHPATNRYGIFDVEWASGVDAPRLDVSLWLNYAKDPLVLMISENGSSHRLAAPVARRLLTHLTAAWRFTGWLAVGVELPVALYQAGDKGVFNQGSLEVQSLDSMSTADMRIVPKIALLQRAKHWVDLAVMPTVTLPTQVEANYLGESSATFIPEAALGLAFGKLRFGGNLGYRLRNAMRSVNLAIKNELTYRGGFAYMLNPGAPAAVELLASMGGATRADAIFQSIVETPIEFTGGARVCLRSNLFITLGWALGVNTGYGTPRYRALTALSWAPAEEPPPKLQPPEEKPPAPPPVVAPRPVEAPPVVVEAPPVVPAEPEPVAPQKVRITGNKLEILDKVYFDTSKSTIQPRSIAILQQVAAVLQRNLWVKKVRVEGHTDSAGNDAANLTLSRDRAQAVRNFLIKEGVDANRLDAAGYGETRPIATNATVIGREANRRVEFVILQTVDRPEGTAIEAAPPPPTK